MIILNALPNLLLLKFPNIQLLISIHEYLHSIRNVHPLHHWIPVTHLFQKLYVLLKHVFCLLLFSYFQRFFKWHIVAFSFSFKLLRFPLKRSYHSFSFFLYSFLTLLFRWSCSSLPIRCLRMSSDAYLMSIIKCLWIIRLILPPFFLLFSILIKMTYGISILPLKIKQSRWQWKQIEVSHEMHSVQFPDFSEFLESVVNVFWNFWS